MTNAEDSAPVFARYLALAENVETPDIDRVILAAAAHQAARQRFMRRTPLALLLLATAILAARIDRRAQPVPPAREAPSLMHAGAIEGLTRSYLLQVGTRPYSGPGLTEGAP